MCQLSLCYMCHILYIYITERTTTAATATLLPATHMFVCLFVVVAARICYTCHMYIYVYMISECDYITAVKQFSPNQSGYREMVVGLVFGNDDQRLTALTTVPVLSPDDSFIEKEKNERMNEVPKYIHNIIGSEI